MNFKYCVYIVMFIHSQASVVLADEEEKIYSINDKVFRCSRLLSNILFNFCDNAYKIVKRDTKSVMIEKMLPEDLKLQLNRRRRIGRARSRVRRQIADECCNRPCTVADIIMYCPSDAKLVQERPDIFENLNKIL